MRKQAVTESHRLQEPSGHVEGSLLHPGGEPGRSIEALERTGARVHHRVAHADRLHPAIEHVAVEVVLRRVDRLLQQHAVRARPGRVTVIFECRAGKWLAVHTHFSLYLRRP